jgi:hypothetical protein
MVSFELGEAAFKIFFKEKKSRSRPGALTFHLAVIFFKTVADPNLNL